jgi:hypothetical protein
MMNQVAMDVNIIKILLKEKGEKLAVKKSEVFKHFSFLYDSPNISSTLESTFRHEFASLTNQML